MKNNKGSDRKFVTFLKKSVCFFGKTVKWLFIVFIVFTASLFCREQRLPGSWVDLIAGRCSSSNLVLRCESATFGFRNGLKFSDVAVYDLERRNSFKPVVRVKDLAVDFFRRRLLAVELAMASLPDGYYQPGYRERNEPVGFEFPSLPRFKLVLIRPHILGIEAERVVAAVKIRPRRVDVSEIRIDWPDIDRRMKLDGFTFIDLAAQRVYGEVKGQAKQANIRPLLVALDIPVSLPYMDAFTEVGLPVPAFCSWDVNLVNNDFKLKLSLSPTMGKYNGVPMRRAEGELSVHVYTRGDKMNFNTRIGPLKAWDVENGVLDGSLLVRGTNDTVHLDFDVASSLGLADALAVADCFDTDVLDCLKCDTPPAFTVKGTLATDSGHWRDNDLSGEVSFESGSFFGIPLKDVSFGYSYVGNVLSFFRGSATGKDGGVVTGGAEIVVAPPGGEDRFSLDFRYRGGTMSELADVLELDMGDRHGKVDGWIRMSAPLKRDAYGKLNGKGRIEISDGHLAQMKLFMGLTRLLAKNVPGISGLVTQSRASADFTIVDGVLQSDDVVIEGGLVSIHAHGKYDIAGDDLDFTVRVELIREKSIIGRMVQPVMLPFSKLLMEFKVEGPVEKPHWKYISVLDRVH